MKKQITVTAAPSWRIKYRRVLPWRHHDLHRCRRHTEFWSIQQQASNRSKQSFVTVRSFQPSGNWGRSCVELVLENWGRVEPSTCWKNTFQFTAESRGSGKIVIKLRRRLRRKIGKREILKLLFERSIKNLNLSDFNYIKKTDGQIRLKETKLACMVN